MKSADNRTQKILALQAAITGNTQPLQEFKAQRGRPYTAHELDQRRQFLTQLYGYEASLADVINFFGRHEPLVAGSCFALPSGLLLYF